MNNTHIQLNTKTLSTSVGSVALARKALFTTALIAAGVLAPSQAFAHCSLSISPGTITAGQSATLSWTTGTDVTFVAFSIDNGIGNVTPVTSGSMSVSPTSNTTYNGVASFDNGYGQTVSVNCSTSITVTPPACHQYVPGVDPDLWGTVTKGNATLTIPDNYCPVKVTFASYDIPSGNPLPFSTQVLNDHITDTYGPGNHDIGPLTMKSCNWQNDLYLGDVVNVLPDDINQHPKLINYDIVSGKTCVPPPACHLTLTKSVDKPNAAPGDTVEYTINFKNDGTADCTGGGVEITDAVDSRLTFVSESHSSNVNPGYNGTGMDLFTASDHTLRWNAGTVVPGASGSIKWKATVGTPNACSETIPNVAKISSDQYDNFHTWVESNNAPVTVAKSCGGDTIPACTLSADPSTLAVGGGSSTLSWTTTNATAFTIDNGIGSVTPVAAGATTTSTTATVTYTGTATGPGGTVTCASTVTVPPPVTGCTSNCGGGCTSHCGGGGSNPSPHILFAALPHVGEQPLIYLSQIPYTGLSLGTIGTVVYWAALVAWALALAYLVLFGAVPFANRSLQNFGTRVKEVLNTPAPVATVVEERIHRVAPVVAAAAPVPAASAPKGDSFEAPRGYSSYDGFKSFAREGTLSIDDIVKGLARSHAAPAVAVVQPEPAHVETRNVEPVYENVEPIYQNVEPIMNEPMQEVAPVASVSTNVRGFVAALIEGDRNAVFAGLRQYTRGAGASEKLISDVACLLDDAYRARMDGTSSDADIVRLVARLDTPTLERLVASLTTAIDSSYTTGVTGAKMALTRALGVLGA